MSESAASVTITSQDELYSLVNNWKRNLNTTLDSLIFSNYTDGSVVFETDPGLINRGIEPNSITNVSITNIIVNASTALERFTFGSDFVAINHGQGPIFVNNSATGILMEDLSNLVYVNFSGIFQTPGFILRGLPKLTNVTGMEGNLTLGNGSLIIENTGLTLFDFQNFTFVTIDSFVLVTGISLVNNSFGKYFEILLEGIQNIDGSIHITDEVDVSMTGLKRITGGIYLDGITELLMNSLLSIESDLVVVGWLSSGVFGLNNLEAIKGNFKYTQSIDISNAPKQLQPTYIFVPLLENIGGNLSLEIPNDGIPVEINLGNLDTVLSNIAIAGPMAKADFSSLTNVSGTMNVNLTGGILNCSTFSFGSQSLHTSDNYACADGKAVSPSHSASSSPSALPTTKSKPETLTSVNIIGGTIGTVIGFIVFILLLWFLKAKKKWKPRAWKTRIAAWRAELGQTLILEAPGDM